MRFVPIENVFLEVQEEIGDDWYGEQPVYEKWVIDAISKISGKVSYVTSIEVEDVIDNGYRVPFCPDTKKVLGVLPGDRKKELSNIFARSCSYLKLPEFEPGNNDFGNGFLVITQGLIRQNQGIRWKLEDGHIQFYEKLEEKKVTVLKKKIKRDKRGKVMVAETDVMACAYYILMRIARRTRWKQKEHRLSEAAIGSYDTLFTVNLMNARAEGAKLSKSREYELNQMMSFRQRSADTRY